MADGEGSKTAKIVVGIVLGVLVLGVVCCGVGYALIPQKAKSLFGQGVEMARLMGEGVKAMDDGFGDEFGDGARWQLGGAGSEALLLVGVPADVELDAATVEELQDKAWVRYTKAFAQGGMPLSGVAIGRAGEREGGGTTHKGAVSQWTKNIADVPTLVERTGVEAPPEVEFFDSMEELKKNGHDIEVKSDGEGVNVEVKVNGGDDEEPPPEER